MDRHRDEIVSGQLVVFFQDECHLLWGDLGGYVWGKTSERVEVPITNERQKQTYYEALNLATQTFGLEGYEKGNSESTLAFLQSLQAQHPGCQIAVIWDGASHHRSQAVKDYLALVNQDLEESKWKLSLSSVCTNAPSRILLRTYGYKQSALFESFITCASHFEL